MMITPCMTELGKTSQIIDMILGVMFKNKTPGNSSCVYGKPYV